MTNKSVQKALAALVTNVNLIENYINFRSQIILDLDLNQSDAKILDDFYNTNKSKFTASARLLKKNRWDDIKSSLPIIVNNIPLDTLNLIWDDYLANCKMVDHIPKNPLAESVIFAKFAEKSPYLLAMQQQLIKYERIRNEVTYKHHKNFRQDNFKIETNIKEDSLSNYAVYLHDCYRIEEFDYDILKIINKKILTHGENLLFDNCVVLFFKNLNKEGIGTLRISNDSKNIINHIESSTNLLQIYSYFQQKLNLFEFLKFFKNLERIGVLIFYRVEH